GDTDLTPDAGKTSASRQTFVSGNAARFAGEDLRLKLLALLAAPSDVQLDIDGTALTAHAGSKTWRMDLTALVSDDHGNVALGEGSFDPLTTPPDQDGQGAPYATYGFAAQMAEVEVD